MTAVIQRSQGGPNEALSESGPSAGNKAAEAATSIALTGHTYAVGDIVIVAIGADNAGASGASSLSSVTDSQGNGPGGVYTIVSANQTPGSVALDGCTGAFAYAVVTKPLTGTDTISVNWSPNTTAKACEVAHLTGPGGTPDVRNDWTVVTSGTNKGTAGATFTVTTGSLSIDDILVAVAVNESAVAPSADTDTTNGTWSGAATVSSGGGGGDATKIAISLQFKQITGAGTQTFNAATGATTDWVAVYLVLRRISVQDPVMPPLAAVQASVW